MVLLNLLPEQQKSGLMPTLGSIGQPNCCDKGIEIAAEAALIDVKRFRMRNGLNLLGALSILRYAKQFSFNVIHCHGYKANILMGLLPSALRQMPHLVTLHGWTSTKRFSKMWFYEWLDAVMARRANVVVAVSEAMRNHPRITQLKLKPRVIHNGIPQSAERQGRDANLQSVLPYHRQKGLTVGAIGRLSTTKGFDVLINAIANVRARDHDVTLVIIGDGPERGRLEALARHKNIIDNVHFCGYVDQASRLLKLFDIFVVSSFSEGLPIVLLEAMREGIPIVATCVGGIPEALDKGRCGTLVKPGNAEEMADAILRIHLSTDLQQNTCKAAQQRVRTEFSSETMAVAYQLLYQQL